MDDQCKLGVLKPNQFRPSTQDIKGAKSRTLGEAVYELISTHKADTPDYQALVAFFGHEKLKKLYDEELNKRIVK